MKNTLQYLQKVNDSRVIMSKDFEKLASKKLVQKKQQLIPQIRVANFKNKAIQLMQEHFNGIENNFGFNPHTQVGIAYRIRVISK